MNPETIDRILTTDDELIPSSGFLSAVMERVREEAAAPPPLPFPWKRAIPGMVVVVGVLGWSGFEVFRYAGPAALELQFALPQFSASAVHALEQAGWTALALVVSLLSWFFSSRVIRGSGSF